MSRKLRASMTVEAAVVVSTALIAIVSVMRWDIDLHDMVVGAVSAQEAAELYSHMEDKDIAAASEYGNRRLSGLFSGAEYEISMEEYLDGSKVTLYGADTERSYKDGGFNPEYCLRKMTVLEGVAGSD